jgi:hypothetical protein
LLQLLTYFAHSAIQKFWWPQIDTNVGIITLLCNIYLSQEPR